MLPRLTAEDLKELGVMVVGHRRRLLDAIIALQGEPVATLGGSAPTLGDHPGLAPEGAERRQLTVMFCDLVGSTTLALGPARRRQREQRWPAPPARVVLVRLRVAEVHQRPKRDRLSRCGFVSALAPGRSS
jgi:hypothetical protein